MVKASFAFSKKSSKRSYSKSVFFAKTNVFDATYVKKFCLFSVKNLLAIFGTIVIDFTFSLESCVSTSKVRILSISSPKNSIRYGSSWENEYTSTIPPRTENSPGSVTKSTRLNLYSNKISFKKSKESVSPNFIFKVFLSSSLRVTTFSKSASGYVTITAGFFLEFILFNTSARKRTLALSVSSIW